jgi:hypothetical protein
VLASNELGCEGGVTTSYSSCLLGSPEVQQGRSRDSIVAPAMGAQSARSRDDRREDGLRVVHVTAMTTPHWSYSLLA